ncbi:hypothetical protein Dvina_52645 [Dactylosporangium vinaceum]|uniref:Tat pathway signal sequence domain protein n=1 Tax=Dactylosporangium vinaceum TaxID=53362 RepID=A0ABV5MQH5_9ACTN|nr:hypothetical protein [Dactylosporangium vinaceum]UAB96472.1 hypothetical protein Dvina_52645 [Dactylosporangium vinaceum]
MGTPEMTFEDRLLDELKLVVATGSAAGTAPAPARSTRRRRPVAVAAVAATSAVALGAVLITQLNQPAYAVSRDDDGSVRVSIFDYRDPDGLRARLAAFGVRAQVDFLPFDRTCREPRADYVPAAAMPLALVEWPEPGRNDSYFRIHPQYIAPGQTLVYTVRVNRKAHDQRAAIRLANGPVAACDQVPA